MVFPDEILWQTMILVLVVWPTIVTDAALQATCLKTRYHLNTPQRNVKLYQNCSPWSETSCCSWDISAQSHKPIDQYGFNISHCGPMAPACHEYFIRELCYYSCDPYTKPWIVGDPVTGKERIMQVPLCKTDCLEWWNRCADTAMTCVRNWRKHFVWMPDPHRSEGGNHRTNFCPEGTRCRLFKHIYVDAFDFCQTVWDEAWTVATNEHNCIRLNFANQTVSNRLVSEFYMNQKQQADIGFNLNLALIFRLIAFVIIAIAILYVLRCVVRFLQGK